MKIFDNDIQTALKLYTFIDFMDNLASVYLALIIIKKLIDDFALVYAAETSVKLKESDKRKKIKPYSNETKPKLKKLVKLETIQDIEKKDIKDE